MLKILETKTKFVRVSRIYDRKMATSVQQNVAEYVRIFTSCNFDADQTGRVIIAQKLFIRNMRFVNVVQIMLKV